MTENSFSFKEIEACIVSLINKLINNKFIKVKPIKKGESLNKLIIQQILYISQLKKEDFSSKLNLNIIESLIIEYIISLNKKKDIYISKEVILKALIIYINKAFKGKLSPFQMSLNQQIYGRKVHT